MSIIKQSAPIEAVQDGIGYSLVFVDNEPGEDTVLMRLTFEDGAIREVRVPRGPADAKLKTLIEDRLDARLHAIIADYKTG